MAEAIALALTKVLAGKKALRAAWDGGEPVSRTLAIPTHQGEIEVTLRAPFVRSPEELDPSHDILADLAAFADSSHFGLAESLVMAGRDAGFDMDSREGIEAWMQSIQGKPLPPSIPIPSFGAPYTGDKKAAKAKKGKRKAARKSRKRKK
jgi:hypothetical protein